ncbi:MAG: methyltransferase, partial [Acidimicrobiia bacterium]|nr:methyltransferase [Acidimicrobiia bacterium]
GAAYTIDAHLGPQDWRQALRTDVLHGLKRSPKTLPPKWFYDHHGSELFDQITRLPEYYPTRSERQIIERRADEIMKRAGADTVIELGSGTSTKTELLLDAGVNAGIVRRFVPFDVSETTLRDASGQIALRYPSVAVHAVVGDFEHHLGRLPVEGRTMVLFLGSTIGNFEPVSRKRFLHDLRATLNPGDSLLLGTDLVKAPPRLIAAYDDSAGVTAAFNRNVLTVVNRELGANFQPELFDHVAHWDPDNEWMEMRLRASVLHEVRVEALDLDVRFEGGEELHTEISAKFRHGGVQQELTEAGFELAEWWTDDNVDFALSLAFAQ